MAYGLKKIFQGAPEGRACRGTVLPPAPRNHGFPARQGVVESAQVDYFFRNKSNIYRPTGYQII